MRLRTRTSLLCFVPVAMHSGGGDGFAPDLPAVELHRENWNGTAYPSWRAGEQTSIDARIIQVADPYDARTTDQTYCVGITHDQAVGIILANAGGQFDPNLASILAGLPIQGSSGMELREDELVAQLC